MKWELSISKLEAGNLVSETVLLISTDMKSRSGSTDPDPVRVWAHRVGYLVNPHSVVTLSWKLLLV